MLKGTVTKSIFTYYTIHKPKNLKARKGLIKNTVNLTYLARHTPF